MKIRRFISLSAALFAACWVSWSARASWLDGDLGLGYSTGASDFGVPWNDSHSVSVRPALKEGTTGLYAWYERIDVPQSSMSLKSDNFGDQNIYGVGIARTAWSGALSYDASYSRRGVEEPLSIAKGRFHVDMDVYSWELGLGVRVLKSKRADMWLCARYVSWDPVEPDSNANNPLPYKLVPKYAIPTLQDWARTVSGLSGSYELTRKSKLTASLEGAKTGGMYGLGKSTTAVRLSLGLPWQVSRYVAIAPEASVCRIVSGITKNQRRDSAYLGLRTILSFSPHER